MAYTVEFVPEAVEQLAALYRYIATAASPEIAQRYSDAIVNHCEELRTFPHRGNQRDDIRPGLRITNYRKRTVIALLLMPSRSSSWVSSTVGRTLKSLCNTNWTISSGHWKVSAIPWHSRPRIWKLAFIREIRRMVEIFREQARSHNLIGYGRKSHVGR